MAQRLAPALTALLILVGLGDALYMTWDHQVHRIDPRAESEVCGRGEGCEISRFSAWSEVPLGPARPGIPVSLTGAAAYLALLALLLRRRLVPDDPRSARLVFVIAAASLLFSAWLAIVSLRTQGQLCPLCTVLYVVNAGVFMLAPLLLRESIWSAARGAPAAAWSRSAMVAAAVFGVAVLGGYAAYAPPVHAAMQARQTRLLDEASKIRSLPRFDLDTAGRPTLGDPTAPVHLVEIGDLQCPHCALLYDALHEVQAERPGAVKVTYLHYPLDSTCNPNLSKPFHPAACFMAYAAECAHQQGQFDAMMGWLFEHPQEATREAVIGHASTLGLDAAGFGACLDDGSTRAAVAADVANGTRIGLRGTPVLFVDGHMIVGGRSKAVMLEMVDTLLGKE